MSEKQPHVDWGSAPQIMSAPPTPTAKLRPKSRDTGFPEPFGDNCNTTRPHPDADLSPNATISFDSLTAEQSMKRRRVSMLSKHRRTKSQNSTQGSTVSQGIHGIFPRVAGTVAGAGARAASPTSSSALDGSASLGSARGEDTPPTSPDTPSTESKRKSFLGKLRRW